MMLSKAFWTFCSSVAVASLFGLFLLILKHVLKRQRMSKLLPGMKVRFLDFWADAKNFQKNLPENLPNCRNVFLLQTYSGYTQLFRSKMIFNFWYAFTPVVYIVKAQAVEELIAGTSNLQKSWFYDWVHPWVNTGLATSYGDKWRSRRKLLTPSFHFDILRDFLPTINEQSQVLLSTFRKETEKDWTDVLSHTSLCTLDIICETTLGVSVNAQQNSKSDYVEAITRVSSIVMRRMSHPAYMIDWVFNLSNMGREFKKDVELLHEFTRSVIRKKKAKLLQDKTSYAPGKRKALMDMLLEHHLKYGDLSEEGIREEVDTFTFGGHDTTATGISWALYLIGLYKDVQDRIHEELDYIFGDDDERLVTTDDLGSMVYLERVLKESLRLYPAVPLIGRKTTPGTVLNGFEIPEGTACGILIYELHRDPDVFPNPEKFDPDRFLPEISANRHPFAYIPFSAGPRNCIGQRFALMEEKVIVANILRTFTLESIEARDKVQPAPEIILRSAEPLKVRIRHRKF